MTDTDTAMLNRRKGSRAKKGILRGPAADYGGPGGEVMFYRASDGTVTLDVRLEQETIWLSLNQMAALFDRDKSVISRHLRNIFNSNELDHDSVVAFFATTASDGKTYHVEYFNLDAILSVGYRVNSKRGTQFRIWASQVLRDHILKGYSINIRRLEELQQTVRLIARVADRRDFTRDEATALLKVVRDYSLALDLLDDYDHRRLPPPGTGTPVVQPLGYQEAHRIIEGLRRHFAAGGLFGREKDQGLKSSLAAVMQSAGGRDAYSSLEEKAAHLLYFVVKNHAFVDGNKRIGAALFLWFLDKNDALYDPDGERRISEAALVALTLLIAESHPEEKEIILRIVTHLLQGRAHVDGGIL